MEKDISSRMRSLATLETIGASQKNFDPTKAKGLKLRAIIGKTRGKAIADIGGSGSHTTSDRINDNDKYEIEGILQDCSTGWITILTTAYRTNSRSISSSAQTKDGKNLYIETGALEEGVINVNY